MSKKVETPDWASELVREALDLLGCKYRPEIRWRVEPNSRWYRGTARSPYKKGWNTYKGKRYYYPKGRTSSISITMGDGVPEWRQKLIVLHETAHIATPFGHSHSPTFWRNAWTLYKHFGLNLEQVLNVEKNYKVEAEKQYRYMTENDLL